MHGHNIHIHDGRVLSGIFQDYVIEGMRRRRAVAAAAVAAVAGDVTD